MNLNFERIIAYDEIMINLLDISSKTIFKNKNLIEMINNSYCIKGCISPLILTLTK